MPYCSNLWMMLTMSLFGAAVAANHEIGDAAGWTAAGTVDYINWASAKNFKVGDRLDFKYNHEFHNVIEVSHQDYESCNSSSPIFTYTTGHDSVELTSAGHHYFLCGTPAHCDAGQKLDVFVRCRHDDDDDSPDPTPPVHRNSSSQFADDLCLIFHVVLWYFVWHEFV